ncbi:MAG: P-loop NTPase fold protein [Terriglobia bacterium]
MTDNARKHLFSADRPITSRKDDLLGRADFAESLASAIKGWTGNDSLVIALYGSWGTGKSSLKNMVRESLRESKQNPPLIVEFNPWQWAGQEQLAAAFFQEIALALGRGDKSKKARKRASKWLAYGAYLKVGSFLAAGVRNTVLWPLAIIGVIGVGGSLVQAGWMRPMLVSVGLIAWGAWAILKWGGGFADTVAAVFSSLAEVRQQSLHDMKDELARLLRGLEKPVLVIIDDVDRLDSEEIRLLFRLVKANADFPNIVYLLLFQRDIVEKSLAAITSITGSEYLEKIVQVGFDVPRIQQTQVEKVLFAGLDELLREQMVAQRFDQNRWGNLFMGGLRPYFQTLRDVYRFLSTLSFHISLFRARGSFEVNPVDLIALEVLRLFEPEVFHRLPLAKSALTESPDVQLHGQPAEDAARKTVESLVEQADDPDRVDVKEILKQLFLPAEWVFGGSRYSPDFADRWFRELRACHRTVFDRYFHLAIPEGDISQGELDLILSLAGSRDLLATEFRSLNKRGLLGIALDRLEAYKETISLEHAVPFTTALLDVGDELPQGRPGLFEIEADMHAARIVYWYLRREQDIEKRGRFLKEAFTATPALYLPVFTTCLEDSKEQRQKGPDAQLVDEASLKELREICVDKIKRAADSGILNCHPQMGYILYRWREWASPEEPNAWVEKLVQSREGLLSFLTAFVYRSTSHGLHDYVVRTRWRINLKSLEVFVSINTIEKKVTQLQIENLGEKEQRAVHALQKALKRRREGKSENQFWPDDE